MLSRHRQLKSRRDKTKLDPFVVSRLFVVIIELFIEQAKKFNKPIAPHAIHEDAILVCDLLEKYNIKKAHFHWFKGDL